MSEFKTWDSFGMNQVQMMQCRSRRNVAGALRFIVNARGLQPECARVLQETLILSVLMYDSETLI